MREQRLLLVEREIIDRNDSLFDRGEEFASEVGTREQCPQRGGLAGGGEAGGGFQQRAGRFFRRAGPQAVDDGGREFGGRLSGDRSQQVLDGVDVVALELHQLLGGVGAVVFAG